MKKEKRVDLKYNLKIYLGFLKKYKFIFIVTALLVLLGEIIRIMNSYLFKIITDKGTAFVGNLITREAYVKILLIIAAIFISAAIIKTIIKWTFLHFINKLEANLIRDVKMSFFNHLVSLSHSFHTSHRTGSLISRLSRGGNATERMTDFLIFNILPLLFQVLIVGASLIYLEWKTAIVIAVTAIVFLSYSLYMQHIQKKANAKMNKVEDIEKANISDIFTNIDSIKYFGKEYSIKNKFSKLSANTRKALLKFWNYFRWMDSGQSIIISIGTFFMILFPIRSFLDGEITLGTLVFVYSVYGSLFDQLFGFMHGIRNYYRAMMDFEDLFQYKKIEQEVKDSPNAKELKINKGEIEFRNVSFKYHDRYILKNFNLKIKPGEKIALVGHSGSGKSTLIKLLYRLYDIQKGEIFIDKKNIKSFKQESLRSELSIVPQECILFDDTIYNNLLFSRPQASRREVMNAIKSAQLDEVIQGFPNKENTIVGERGVKLSGGEKQRVSIARAILADKKAIVLDEATSSLDSQTESEIQKDLKELLQGRTSIIIAHRLSTIMNADRIIVLNKGEIVQIGNHNKLINQPGPYRKLWNLQKGGYLRE